LLNGVSIIPVAVEGVKPARFLMDGRFQGSTSLNIPLVLSLSKDPLVVRQAHHERGMERTQNPQASHARANTASSMGSVSRPVWVFCWLGW